MVFHLFCPACGAPLAPRLGCDSCCLTRAIDLQLRRFGTELGCNACGHRYIMRASETQDAAWGLNTRWQTDADWLLQQLTVGPSGGEVSHGIPAGDTSN